MQNRIILTVLSAIIFFILGFAASDFLNNKNNNKIINNDSEESYQAGWNAAKQRLDQTGASYERNILGYEIKSVYGTVEKIEGDKVYAKIRPVEPLADPELDERIIIINADTEIIKYVQIEEELNEQAGGDMNQPETAEGTAGAEARKMSISDLISGTEIIAHANNDITNEKQFIASQIVIYEN